MNTRSWRQVVVLSTFFALSEVSSTLAFQPSAQCPLNNVYTIPSAGTKRLSSHQSVVFRRKSETTLNSWGSDEEIEGSDRIKSCIPYVLPLLDGDYYGQYIYQRVPPLKFLDDLFISPLVSIFQSFPFLGLILFVLFSVGSRNIDSLSRPVRFNAQQAVLIDIALIFPTLIGEGLTDVGIPRIYEEMGNNFVYYFLMSSIFYSVFSNLSGRKPSGIPYISDAAEYITGPF